jgi:hypothetical protein
MHEAPWGLSFLLCALGTSIPSPLSCKVQVKEQKLLFILKTASSKLLWRCLTPGIQEVPNMHIPPLLARLSDLYLTDFQGAEQLG